MNKSKQNQKLSPETDPMVSGKTVQRWSAARKREVVLRLLRGEALEAVSREVGVCTIPAGTVA
jgi:transposase-like protein